MPHPQLHLLRWPALLTSAAILILYIISVWFTTGVIHSSWAVGVESGSLVYERVSPLSGMLLLPTRIVFDPRQTVEWHWWFQSMFASNYTKLYIPLWLPLLLTTIPTTLLWRSHLRHRRQSLLHLCPSCHYPLTGLPQSSPCPECGRARP